MEQSEELRKAISLLIDAGYQIDKEAFEYLKNLPQSLDLNSLIATIIEELNKLQVKPLFINRKLLEKTAEELQVFQKSEVFLDETVKTRFKPYAKEVEPDIKVLKDPTNEINATGSLEDFISYFQDRFKKIRRIMNGRLDVRDVATISEAFKAPNGSEVKFICMIREKRESKTGIFLQVEDMEATATVFVPYENHEVLSKAQRLVLDLVVCISAKKVKDDFLMVKEILFPDVPIKKTKRAPIPVYAALLSDLHIGSRMFMKQPFKHFLQWLKGETGDTHLKQIAGHIKYLVIAGDIVDGVGIYPQQIKELQIKDVYKQYEVAAKILQETPEYIEVIIIPGNHDASRRALPQPAISREYAEPLYEARKIYSLGNPSIFTLHGVTMLLSHGRSLDDVISSVPGMSFQAPDEAMKLLLQCRHLAPTYGSRTLIASERTDHLVIETVPDIFQAGHVHVMSYSYYRGILVVNSGAWQTQTEYQKEMGHAPNPGIIPVVNLQDLGVTLINFGS